MTKTTAGRNSLRRSHRKVANVQSAQYPAGLPPFYYVWANDEIWHWNGDDWTKIPSSDAASERIQEKP
jgi:hypothetical protein